MVTGQFPSNKLTGHSTTCLPFNCTIVHVHRSSQHRYFLLTLKESGLFPCMKSFLSKLFHEDIVTGYGSRLRGGGGYAVNHREIHFRNATLTRN